MFPSLPQTGMEPPAEEEDIPQSTHMLKQFQARTYNLLNPENLLQYELDMERILLHQQAGMIKVLHREVHTDTTREVPRTVVHLEWVEFTEIN